MIRSMTGFAEKKYDQEDFSVKIQIKSINHRFFDWNFRGIHFSPLESKLRTMTQRKIYRGRIDVLIDLKDFSRSQWEIEINEDLLKTVVDALQKVSEKWKKDQILSVDNILSIPHVVETRRKSLKREETRFIETCFDQTLDELLRVKLKEGKGIQKALQSHVLAIKKSMDRIIRSAGKQPQLIRDKLKERMGELLKDLPSVEEKIITEASFLAQRFDLTEELERLQFHLEHIQSCLSSDMGTPMGKKIDFISQELYREVNTLNAKTQVTTAIQECLNIKGEIESIRQQIQNVE